MNGEQTQQYLVMAELVVEVAVITEDWVTVFGLNLQDQLIRLSQQVWLVEVVVDPSMPKVMHG